MSNVNVRKAIEGTLVVAAVVLLFWFIFRFHNLFLMIFAAIIISTAMRPIVRRLHEHGLPRATGIMIVYGVLLILIGLFIWLGSPFLVDQTATISRTLAETYQIVRQEISGSGNIIIRRLAAAMPTNLSLAVDTPTNGEDVMASLVLVGDMAITGFRALLGIAATFLLAFYWTLESEHIKSAVFLLFPQEKREATRQFIVSVEEKLSGYVIGQGLLVLAVGTLALVAYLLIGLPNALILAIIAGLMEAIPLLGPVLGAIPAGLVALSLSPLHLLWVILATVIIQQLENALLVPRIMNRTIGVRPLVTLLAMYAFGALFGIVGVLVSIPLAAIIQLGLDRFLWQRTGANAEDGRDRTSVLRYQVQDLVQDIRDQLRRKPILATTTTDQLEDTIEAIALDLDSFLAQVKQNSRENHETTG
jgi:predicted PurR-regulated permease PerM